MVVLKISQVKNFVVGDAFHAMPDETKYLVMSKTVYKKLFERVNELKLETLQQAAAHK